MKDQKRSSTKFIGVKIAPTRKRDRNNNRDHKNKNAWKYSKDGETESDNDKDQDAHYTKINDDHIEVLIVDDGMNKGTDSKEGSKYTTLGKIKSKAFIITGLIAVIVGITILVLLIPKDGNKGQEQEHINSTRENTMMFDNVTTISMFSFRPTTNTIVEEKNITHTANGTKHDICNKYPNILPFLCNH